jgi:hypothetical protein
MHIATALLLPCVLPLPSAKALFILASPQNSKHQGEQLGKSHPALPCIAAATPASGGAPTCGNVVLCARRLEVNRVQELGLSAAAPLQEP